MLRDVQHLARTLILALAVAGCGAPPAAPVAPADDQALLVAAMHRYDEAVRAIDGAAIAAMFTADGVLANNGVAIATTPPEIAKFLGSFVGKVRVDATASTVEHVRVDGDRGFVDGHYAQDARLVADDKPIHATGRFTGAWRRVDGAWRIVKLETTPDAR